jgi:antitoxin MazE
MSVDTQIAKWGNSLAVRIPRAIVEQARLAEGDRLSLGLTKDGSVLMRPAKRRYRLSELVSGITTENRHAETSWSGARGKEAW